jgi:hypothetical protein
MALFVLGGFLLKKILGGDDGNKAIQEVTNTVNLSAITNVLVGNNVVTQFTVFGNQQITLNLNGCTVGDVNVSQLNQTGVEIIQTSQLQLNAQILNEFRTNLENTLKNSLERDVTSFFPAFDAVTEVFRKDLTVQQTLENVLTQTIETNVTAQNLSTIQGNVFNTETLQISCKDSFLDSLNVNQELVVNATIKNVVNTVVDAFVTNENIANISNDLEQTLRDSTTQELPLSGAIIAIIVVIAVAVVVVIIVVLVLWSQCKIPGLPPPPNGCPPNSEGKSQININIPDKNPPSNPGSVTSESVLTQ